MPTIKTREFKHTAKSGEVMQFKEPITVDGHGEFTVNIPDDLAPSAQALVKQEQWKGHVRVDKARVNWRIQGRILGEVERFVEDAMKEHMAVEVTQELVIRYHYQNNAAGARAADGTLHPNGHWAAPNEHSDVRSWEWCGNRSIHANNRPELFGVGIVAHVYLKVTYSRQSGSKVQYTDDLPGSHWDLNPMRRLNAFIVQSPERTGVRVGGYMRNGNEPDAGVHEMPYSDAAADFFSDLMVAMIRLGEQLDAFVGDRDRLQIAIERGAGLLTGPGKTEAS